MNKSQVLQINKINKFQVYQLFTFIIIHRFIDNGGTNNHIGRFQSQIKFIAPYKRFSISQLTKYIFQNYYNIL